FSPWAVLVLAVAGLPAFFAEARFSNEAFRLFTWRTPETRQRAYYETAIAREDFAKETQLYGLGPLFLERYTTTFEKLYQEDRALTMKRSFWGWALGLLSTIAFYGAYAWTALAAVAGDITLGEMTMYVMVFRQGQSAFSSILSAVGGMYEDNLYLSNLYEFLETPSAVRSGSATVGAKPGDGLRFESVAFRYPGAEADAIKDVSFHLAPGEKLALVGENGSGKTTLIKLLTRLYAPTGGRILLDGTDLLDWDLDTLRGRIGVIFQDFVRYQLAAGENVGVGDVARIDDRAAWEVAADKGMAHPILSTLPQGYDTQLGRWFGNGRELSLGQWQKVALSRAFMRTNADILVLDEPTAS
ncbi:MAG: ABC transporter ATP-binding protein, partial [Myxococcales bacterium]|nr:ABC transporter ATP-binding protein [Myxococcales bacterium]